MGCSASGVDTREDLFLVCPEPGETYIEPLKSLASNDRARHYPN
jgi:hypothetical protein